MTDSTRLPLRVNGLTLNKTDTLTFIYSEVFYNFTLIDNSGTTCFDVYFVGAK